MYHFCTPKREWFINYHTHTVNVFPNPERIILYCDFCMRAIWTMISSLVSSRGSPADSQERATTLDRKLLTKNAKRADSFFSKTFSLPSPFAPSKGCSEDMAIN